MCQQEMRMDGNASFCMENADEISLAMPEEKSSW